MNNFYGEAAEFENTDNPPPASEPEPALKVKKQLPQRSVDAFWDKVFEKQQVFTYCTMLTSDSSPPNILERS